MKQMHCHEFPSSITRLPSCAHVISPILPTSYTSVILPLAGPYISQLTWVKLHLTLPHYYRISSVSTQ